MKQLFEQQLSSIKTLLLQISNDAKWNDLQNELVKYQIYLKQQLSLNNTNTIVNGTRPTKPPLRLKSNSMSNDKGDDENENENDKDNKNGIHKNRIFPTKPPMRLKQSQLNTNNPLLRLFIRSPTTNNGNGKLIIETIEIVIWNDDNNEIQQIVNKLCYKNTQLQPHKNEIKNTILDLIK